MELFWLLLGGHALADYPLQGDFLGKFKNRHVLDDPLGVRGLWIHCLTAHALIHGLFVHALTGNMALGMAEFVIHWLIDFGKCEKMYGFHTDQALHVACKAIWAAIVATTTGA